MQKPITYEVEETIHSTIEAAFKTPILGDATKILKYFHIPFVKGFINDKTWGQINGTRIPVMPIFGTQGIDTVLDRNDNLYWRWRVTDFKNFMFFLQSATGEWWCTDNNNGSVSVRWKYTFIAKNKFTHVFEVLYVVLFWKHVMNQGIKTIKKMAESGAEYLYS